MNFQTPVGSTRLSLQPPTIGPPSAVTFDPDHPGYEFDFTPLDKLPYCKGSAATTADSTTTAADSTTAIATATAPKSAETCLYMGSCEAVYPKTAGSPFFISTRITEANMTLVCREPGSARGYSCPQTYAYACYDSFDVAPGTTGSASTSGCNASDAPAGTECWGWEKKGGKCWAQRTYFLADIERYTLLLDHTGRYGSRVFVRVCVCVFGAGWGGGGTSLPSIPSNDFDGQ